MFIHKPTNPTHNTHRANNKTEIERIAEPVFDEAALVLALRHFQLVVR